MKRLILVTLFVAFSMGSVFAQETKADKLYDEGVRLYESQCYVNKKVINKWEKAAKQGHLDACYSLALCYSNGWGVYQMPDIAAIYYKFAAERGHVDAQLCLAICYSSGIGVTEDPYSAAWWYRQAAESGNADAQYYLGNCYSHGYGVDVDMKETVRWHKLAAAQGHPEAQLYLGKCYAGGVGVAQNIEEAVRWYMASAESGNIEAQYYVGYCYAFGIGVEQDHAKAMAWLDSIESNYLIDADTRLYMGLCYLNGVGVVQNSIKGAELVKKASQQGSIPAYNYLGACYFEGKGVAKDLTIATINYRKAALEGYADAQANLGVCYLYGWGVMQDFVEAEKWLRLAANQSQEEAMYLLEQMNGPNSEEFFESLEIMKYANDFDHFDFVIEEKEEEKEEIFVTVEEMPTFQGGDLSVFRNWVQQNVKYPKTALKSGIQGDVVIQFVLGADGKMTNFKVLQSPDKSLSDAVIEALHKANNLKVGWKPGKRKGEYVDFSFTLPFRFAIQR